MLQYTQNFLMCRIIMKLRWHYLIWLIQHLNMLTGRRVNTLLPFFYLV
nr:MAG TPA: hypothetical protein [Caudoviricetes sp.]